MANRKSGINRSAISVIDDDTMLSDILRAEMQVVVKKWGNCAAVRLPAPIMKAARLGIDQTVDVKEENGVITLVAVGRRYRLDELLRNTPRDAAVEGWDAMSATGSEVF